MTGKLTKKDIIALGYITLLSIVAVVYGFSIIPSPSSEQQIATDQKRVTDLSNIQAAIEIYYQDNSALPVNLDTLTTQAYDTSTPLEKTDPQTKHPYEYMVTGPYSYKLCATFTTDSMKTQPNQYDKPVVSYPVYNGNFTHPAGHFCFTEQEQPPYNPQEPSTHPTIFPCRAGRLCPMMPVNEPSPAMYNGTPVSPTPAARNGGNAG
jgi:hypothetical protein